jgi:predicted nuclease of predicted toxin-antitoxin system
VPKPLVYLDECVHVGLAVRLRLRGFDADTALECGMIGASDADQLRYATGRDAIIVTHDARDFRLLSIRTPQHSGIATLPYASLDCQVIRAAMLIDWIATFPDHRSRLFRWHDLQQHLIGGGRLPGYGEEDVRRALGQISSSPH